MGRKPWPGFYNPPGFRDTDDEDTQPSAPNPLRAARQRDRKRANVVYLRGPAERARLEARRVAANERAIAIGVYGAVFLIVIGLAVYAVFAW